MKKPGSTHNLKHIQDQFKSESDLVMTGSADLDRLALGLEEWEVVGLIQDLTKSQADHTMPSKKNKNFWQDVYRTDCKGHDLYVKFQQKRDGSYFIVSIHEWDRNGTEY